ncbi:hypothetical protein T484DRAFT_1923601, partial [Baffinella frigidus]
MVEDDAVYSTPTKPPAQNAAQSETPTRVARALNVSGGGEEERASEEDTLSSPGRSGTASHAEGGKAVGALTLTQDAGTAFESPESSPSKLALLSSSSRVHAGGPGTGGMLLASSILGLQQQPSDAADSAAPTCSNSPDPSSPPPATFPPSDSYIPSSIFLPTLETCDAPPPETPLETPLETAAGSVPASDGSDGAAPEQAGPSEGSALTKVNLVSEVNLVPGSLSAEEKTEAQDCVDRLQSLGFAFYRGDPLSGTSGLSRRTMPRSWTALPRRSSTTTRASTPAPRTASA